MARMIKLKGHFFAASNTSGVALEPIDSPMNIKHTSRIRLFIFKSIPNKQALVTAIAGPIKKGAGKCKIVAIEPPTAPMITVLTMVM